MLAGGIQPKIHHETSKARPKPRRRWKVIRIPAGIQDRWPCDGPSFPQRVLEQDGPHRRFVLMHTDHFEPAVGAIQTRTHAGLEHLSEGPQNGTIELRCPRRAERTPCLTHVQPGSQKCLGILLETGSDGVVKLAVAA